MAAAVAAAVVVVVAAMALRSDGDRLDEPSLRQTEGVQLSILGMQRQGDRAIIRCRVENQTARDAASVVMTVQLLGEQGRPIAANPLANVLQLGAGEERTIGIPVALPPGPAASLRPQARVDLVRWAP